MKCAWCRRREVAEEWSDIGGCSALCAARLRVWDELHHPEGRDDAEETVHGDWPAWDQLDVPR